MTTEKSALLPPRSSDLDHLNWLRLAGLDNFQGKSLLDLGCGSGFICHKAMTEGATAAVGVDLVRPELAGAGDWEFKDLNLDGGDWHLGLSRKFDLILAFDILEHLESPYRFLDCCHKSLSDTGQLVLTTPNLLSWERYYRPNDWSGVKDPQHKTLFTKYSLQFLLKKIGFSPDTVQAPMRSLAFLGPLQPQIGGQILCVASSR